MDKSDVEKMPEGMTSEELDALTTGEPLDKDNDLSEAALNEADEAEELLGDDDGLEDEPGEEKIDPKDAVIGDFRRKNRDLELEKARLEGELNVRRETKTETIEKPLSPLAQAKKAGLEDNDDLEGFTMSVDLYERNESFKDTQRNEKAESTQKATRQSEMNTTAKVLQNGDYSIEKLGDGLDLMSVLKTGQHLLDEGDMAKIEVYAKKYGVESALKKSYELCKDAILNSGTTEGRLFKLALAKAAQVKKSKKTKTSQQIDNLITEGVEDETGEVRPKSHVDRLVGFIFD